MRNRWMGLAIAAAMLIFSAVVYSGLPDRIPTHWNIRGEADDWSGRLWGAILAPTMALALWLVIPLLRRIDPRRRNYEKFNDTFWLLLNVLILFIGVMHVLTLGIALGWPIGIGRGVLLIVGVLLAVLGNYLPRLRSNWWMGIRTPWTLDSEKVWRATHRLAGVTFVVGGVLTAVAALLPSAIGAFVAMISIGAAAAIPVAYSYFAYRAEKAVH